MVQHGLKQVKTIIKNVHDTVDYINGSEYRFQNFLELVQQFNLKERRSVLECKTRWNSTYDMLACAIKFKEVFSRLSLEDKKYVYCPGNDDWVKIEKLLEILKVFSDATNIISGSEYPTSNLFLSEIYRIKVMLDKNMDSSNEFVRSVVENMKDRFDKYWGECNLLMGIGSVLDPHLKMKGVEITFPSIFSCEEVRDNMRRVRETLHELFDEYASVYFPPTMEHSGECESGVRVDVGERNITKLTQLLQVVASSEVGGAQKSEVDEYLEDGVLMVQVGEKFDPIVCGKKKP
ncbi:zinc finger BED domain-containing protein RICESLEEPER 2-like [Beta vulgaris subsp. vulgaris]|uniref:zinc finger BED domain-containing protein RICESLEEPER 2-like n=1 Tax=Beta vulgaris subsp. vulgaris TaxID=3555 RepID=UPI00053F2C98|nr:zinc finger BED domain-containing protein RICESLEEPER 2-like [Beta vulgaris subsp. vulgaris]